MNIIVTKTVTPEKTTYEVEGKLHREDGPAIEFANGDKHYYFEGKIHRTDGPAVIYANGDKHTILKVNYIEQMDQLENVLMEIKNTI